MSWSNTSENMGICSCASGLRSSAHRKCKCKCKCPPQVQVPTASVGMLLKTLLLALWEGSQAACTGSKKQGQPLCGAELNPRFLCEALFPVKKPSLLFKRDSLRNSHYSVGFIVCVVCQQNHRWNGQVVIKRSTAQW
mmetsp:Transcript_27744/g.71439  ORF Transcript_27744/g.71439 Transcript_27744/m.71439 type:complete len:137 (-) Transcript_27744:1158-1568(-)